MNSALNHLSPTGRGAGGEGRRRKAPLPPQIRYFAQTLRQRSTDAESLMWLMLRNRRFAGLKFRRQHPVPPYVLDFYCEELKLAVELDGGQHNRDMNQHKDETRTAKLTGQGIAVVRYWNHDVLNDLEAVLEDLWLRVQVKGRPSPLTPLPEGEGDEARTS